MKLQKNVLKIFLICFFISENGFSTSAEVVTGPPLKPSLSEGLDWDPQTISPFLGLKINPELEKCLSQGAASKCLSDKLFIQKSLKLKNTKSEIVKHIRSYKKMPLYKKLGLATQLLEVKSDCHEGIKKYALAWSLERDFPNKEAMVWAADLHKSVSACPTDLYYKEESLIRRSLIYLSWGNKEKAIEILKNISGNDLAIRDRGLYIRYLAQDPFVRDSKNLLKLNPIPLGMYGHLLLPTNNFNESDFTWRLGTEASLSEYSDYLSAIVYCLEKGKLDQLSWLSNQVDMYKLSNESSYYLATVALVFHKAQLDLPVFKLMHHVLAKNPQWASPDLLPLLFPIRYWQEIQLASKQDMDPVLIKSLIRQESAFSSKAMSSAKAMGLMQLVPSTARKMGLKDKSKLFDPETNIHMGAAYLRYLIERFKSIELALASYNAGPKSVDDWKKRYVTDDPELFVEMMPFKETREYVRLIKRNQAIYKQILLK